MPAGFGPTLGAVAIASRLPKALGTASSPLPTRVVDVAVTATVTVWALPNLPWPWRPPGHNPALSQSAAVVGLFVLQTVPFLWRRRYPGLVLLASLTVLAGRAAMELNIVSAIWSTYCAVYVAGRFGGHRTRAAGRTLALVAVCLAVVAFLHLPRERALAYVLFAAIFLTGEGERRRLAAFSAAVAQEAAAERFRIARDLHDVLAHQLSLIALHAGAARLAAGEQPERLTDAIATIETTARDAAGELSTLLGVLRRDGAYTSPPLAPAPTISDVAVLVARARSAGLHVRLQVEGKPRPVSDSLQASVYRIVQEALTNVTKHSSGAATTVLLRYGPGALCVEVENDVRPDTPSRSALTQAVTAVSSSETRSLGHGLTGMTERVTAHGGTLEAGVRGDRGFLVRATIPCEGP